jgi:hypothetical protein
MGQPAAQQLGPPLGLTAGLLRVQVRMLAL